MSDLRRLDRFFRGRRPDLGCDHCGGTGQLGYGNQEVVDAILDAYPGQAPLNVYVGPIPDGKLYVFTCRCAGGPGAIPEVM